ncbi:anti-repressor SinI family protein [Pseudalkalibacillus caeni]|uniref:DNA-binding anti-repressor SinI n=1 Tax=Exobacillus caeni TaxID=2574798 RepID=A0A5R9EXI2_9BACL|nr:anti-repressor SinI family protein [Pseudalkalibacillus caeni]TLS35797.1 DNA-binding anti-repressor SinI [Pseudalkalibacillus caeni]
MNVQSPTEKLDKEWIILITKAKEAGFSVNEVRLFLKTACLKNF